MISFADGPRPYVLLLLLCLVLYVPGLTAIPPVDRDESRFAQASRQMLESHDFVRIRFQDAPRHRKPVGIYWLQATAVKATGTLASRRIWPYRLPSVAGATLATLLTFGLGRKLFPAPTALLGAALMAGSLLLVVEAHLAQTDAMLLASAAGAQGALGLIYLRARRGEHTGMGTALAFWLAQGAAILLKGPIVPLVSALTIGALVAVDRDATWLKRLRAGWGILAVALVVCPWAIAIGFATHGAFFRDAVTVDLLPKVVEGREEHGFPPGFYTLLLPLTLWPASLYLLPGLRQAWLRRTELAERFCLAWIVPTWIVFELIRTKLPHYVLPTYPALALLAANAILADGSDKPSGRGWIVARVGFGLWALVALGLAATVVALPRVFNGGFDPRSVWLACIGMIVAGIVLWNAFLKRPRRATCIAILGAFLVFAPVVHLVLPGINGVWVSRAMAEATARHVRAGKGLPPQIGSAGYEEPSLVFQLGTATKLLTGTQAAQFLYGNPDAMAWVSNKAETDFQQAATELKLTLQTLETVQGFNYSNGRKVTTKLYALATESGIQHPEF